MCPGCWVERATKGSGAEAGGGAVCAGSVLRPGDHRTGGERDRQSRCTFLVDLVGTARGNSAQGRLLELWPKQRGGQSRHKAGGRRQRRQLLGVHPDLSLGHVQGETPH